MTRKARFLVALAVATVLPGLGAVHLMRDPTARFIERRSAIAAVDAGKPVRDGESLIQTVRLTATSGLVVDLAVRRHRADTTNERLPLVVILGGHVTGAGAVRLVGETPGLVVAAVAYPFAGDHRPSKLTFLRQIPMIRGALLDTPPALMLALDWLLAQPGVDPYRIEAVGVSLGAPFVTIAGAIDSRITRVWAIHGSGGSYAPLEASMKKTIPFAPLRSVAALTANVIIGGPRLAPERWVARIAPRPFIMVNARDDERMRREAVDALFEAASEPKEIIWMSGGHVHPGSPVIQQLLDVVLARVRQGL
jgi:hypothetical protein